MLPWVNFMHVCRVPLTGTKRLLMWILSLCWGGCHVSWASTRSLITALLRLISATQNFFAVSEWQGELALRCVSCGKQLRCKSASHWTYVLNWIWLIFLIVLSGKQEAEMSNALVVVCLAKHGHSFTCHLVIGLRLQGLASGPKEKERIAGIKIKEHRHPDEIPWRNPWSF